LTHLTHDSPGFIPVRRASTPLHSASCSSHRLPDDSLDHISLSTGRLRVRLAHLPMTYDSRQVPVMSNSGMPETEPSSPSPSPSVPGATYSPSLSPEPKPRTPKKRSSSSAGSPRKKSAPSPGKNRRHPAGQEFKVGKTDAGRKTGSWTKSEVRQLFNAVAIIPVRGISGHAATS